MIFLKNVLPGAAQSPKKRDSCAAPGVLNGRGASGRSGAGRLLLRLVLLGTASTQGHLAGDLLDTVTSGSGGRSQSRAIAHGHVARDQQGHGTSTQQLPVHLTLQVTRTDAIVNYYIIKLLK